MTRAAAPAEESESRRRSRPWWVEVTVVLLVALTIAFLVKTFLFGVYYIPSGSMQNTLAIGDRVLVDKAGYHLHDIHRGDIVVFNGVDSFTPEGDTVVPARNPFVRGARDLGRLVGIAPPSETDFIKRVIGIPGDHVVCCDASGRITVNGTPLDEPYLYPGNVPSSVRFDIVVPPGRLWVMGDHRADSADSRAHLGDPGGGTVPEDKVIGQAVAVIWPLSHARRLTRPATFDQHSLADTDGPGTDSIFDSLAGRSPPGRSA